MMTAPLLHSKQERVVCGLTDGLIGGLLVKARIFTRLEAQLGWIIRAVLEGSELFAKQPQLVGRCHAFEARVFMMDYDLRSLVPRRRYDPSAAQA
ncbi:hypothetical protein DZG01_14510 [Pseudomonas fluorescens]|nr:hypothetical protein DZG01_14510 [Pseudomonas fluorescens]